AAAFANVQLHVARGSCCSSARTRGCIIGRQPVTFCACEDRMVSRRRPGYDPKSSQEVKRLRDEIEIDAFSPPRQHQDVRTSCQMRSGATASFASSRSDALPALVDASSGRIQQHTTDASTTKFFI